MEKLKVKYDGIKEINIKVNMWDEDEEIDLDSLLRIDYAQILGELSSFSVFLNRLGILLAEAENTVREKTLDFKVYRSKLNERLRNELIDSKQKITNDKIDDLRRIDKTYYLKSKILNKFVKERDYVSSIYWSAKSKSDLLSKLALTISPGDIDPTIIRNIYNGVQINSRKKSLKE
jgi:hypothetical protein